MNYLKIFLIGLCCIGFHSCDEDSFTQVVSLDIPEHVPKLSFSLEMSDIDTLIETFVSTSLDINADEDFPTISDAVVNMFKSDELFASFTFNESTGRYESPAGPLLNDGAEYKFEVIHKKYGTATASQRIPDPVNFRNVEYFFDAAVGEFGQKLDVLSFILEDDGSQENFYGFEIIVENKSSLDSNVLIWDIYFESSDPLFEYGSDDALLLSDEAFSGNEYPVRLNIPKFFVDTIFNSEVLVNLKVKNISRDNYLFQRSHLISQQASDNPFVEPVIVHNNIENGFGIFRAEAIKEEILILK